MDNLITLAYFQGLLHLPYVNLQSSSTASSGKSIDIHQQQLERQIAIHQKQFLKKLFGVDMTEEMYNALPDNIKSMLTDDDLFISPIANYVFCEVIPMYQTRLTPSGEKSRRGEGSTDADYQGRMCLAWNQMVYMNAAIRESMESAGIDSDYPTNFKDPIYHLKTEIW